MIKKFLPALIMIVALVLLTTACGTLPKTEEPKNDSKPVETPDLQNPSGKSDTSDTPKNPDQPIPAEEASEGLEFVSNGDGTCTVTGMGTCTDTKVVIPLVSPDGEKVTKIGDRAFYNTELTEITIPKSITTIGKQVFYKSSKLETVYYNSSYRPSVYEENPVLNNASIKKIVFGGNAVLSEGSTELGYKNNVVSVEIADDITGVGHGAFWYCTALETVKIGNGIEKIGTSAFSHCTALTSVTIPNSVTLIDEYAFQGCTALRNITIPDSVTSIRRGAFGGCSALTKVEIGTGVKYVRAGAFDNCNALQGVYITDLEKWCEIDFEYAGSNPLYQGQHNLYLNGELVTNLIIPDTITKIQHNTFQGCTSIVSVEIPDSVTSIEWEAFAGCSSLKNLTIPDSVTVIYYSAFEDGCTALTSITYTGTKAQWDALRKDSGWDLNTGAYTIHCTDGDIIK